jgi:hypothetical protein
MMDGIIYVTLVNNLPYLIGLFVGITIGSVIVGWRKKWSYSRTLLYIIASSLLAYIVVMSLTIMSII